MPAVTDRVTDPPVSVLSTELSTAQVVERQPLAELSTFQYIRPMPSSSLGSVLTAQRELLTPALREEIAPLLELHFGEIAHYQDIPLDVQWPVYQAAQDADCIRIYTLRDEALLVGYAAFFVKQSPHYAGSKQAASDVVFLAPYYRGARSGDSFLAFCDEQLRDEGVQVVYHHLKAAHDWSALLTNRGYELMDLVFAKRLDGAT